MDTGRGVMTPLSEKKAKEIQKIGQPHVFFVGEEVWIHGSRFRIKSMNRRTMRLRLLSDNG